MLLPEFCYFFSTEEDLKKVMRRFKGLSTAFIIEGPTFFLCNHFGSTYPEEFRKEYKERYGEDYPWLEIPKAPGLACLKFDIMDIGSRGSSKWIETSKDTFLTDQQDLYYFTPFKPDVELDSFVDCYDPTVKKLVDQCIRFSTEWVPTKGFNVETKEVETYLHPPGWRLAYCEQDGKAELDENDLKMMAKYFIDVGDETINLEIVNRAKKIVDEVSR